MAGMRPTDIAKMLFDMAHNEIAQAKNAQVNEIPSDLIDTLNWIIQGLAAMNTGLRATYIKLEQIEAQLKTLRT
jgi:hypothetical protein